MATIDALICDQDSCPLLSEGRCLEGFYPPAECPHSRTIKDEQDPDNALPADESAVSISVEGPPVDESSAPAQIVSPHAVASPTIPMASVGGDQALQLETADRLAAARDSTLVLVAGEYEAGKTTLIVEIYASFLDGPFAGFTFAGSRTLRALDTLHWPSRSSSGLAEPATERTQEGLGLLHLAVQREGASTDLLFTDIRGELFEAVINGRPVLDDLPLAKRADVCVIVFDGNKLRSRAGRTTSLMRGKQLIGGLCDAGSVRAGTPALIVATKMDLLTEDEREAAIDVVHSLAGFAAEHGLVSNSLMVSARQGDDRENLDELLRFVSTERRVASVVEPVKQSVPDRVFWR